MLGPPRYLVTQLRSTSKCLIGFNSKASICHKSELPPKKKITWRFPYEKYEWNYFTMWLDPFTESKMTENSKIITIEGNVACGKEDFGRRLADELDMVYFPQVDLESYYINDYGYDYRCLNPLLPERIRSCDWEMWHENPSRHSTIHMQYILFKLRLDQYLRAVRHLLNTGQGVVMERSVFTERVFVEAMHSLGWLPKGYLRSDGIRFYDYKIRYNYIRNLALALLPKPHLTIYLDTPAETCRERIENSDDPKIANSQALIPEFLQSIEQAYMDLVLPKAENYGHVHKVKYPERMCDDEILDVVADIRDLDFGIDHNDTRFEHWDKENRLWWLFTRKRYTTMDCLDVFNKLGVHYLDIAGMGDSISTVDLRLREALYEGHLKEVSGQFHHDWRRNNILTAMFNFAPFETKLSRIIRSDYV